MRIWGLPRSYLRLGNLHGNLATVDPPPSGSGVPDTLAKRKLWAPERRKGSALLASSLSRVFREESGVERLAWALENCGWHRSSESRAGPCT